jgi:asparagine synthase (glutamine-hydrolysing)
MCGIVGIASFNDTIRPSLGQLRAMCETIVHRGPDEDGFHLAEGVGLGMRRLSIIDLEGGQQPIFNEDRTICTVMNGEIYNFRELRRELEAKGHRFATNSDTEVIVHAYEEYGSGCAEVLNGMFAFAVHDLRQNKLLLARDHIGIKPLFYSFDRDRLVWGSEIQALLASGLIERSLDCDALSQFLVWEYVPAEGTLLQSVRKLRPGHIIEIDLKEPRCQPNPYWDVPQAGVKTGMTTEDWAEAVDAKLHECVQRQLVSDVPLGAFLSGGVDSSLMAAHMGPATTFSIGFDDPSYNELSWARRVAGHLGLDHHDEVIRPSVAEMFDHLMNFMDDPIGDFSIFPTYLVSKLARQQVKVVLSGDGGDELFGGYETYLADRWSQTYRMLPKVVRTALLEPFVNSLRPRPAKKGLINKAKRFVEGLSHSEKLSHTRWRLFDSLGDGNLGLYTTEFQRALTQAPEAHVLELFDKAADRQPLNASLYVDLKSYLCDNILVKVDRMSMANSLEARVPYLDRELVELAFQIPDDHKLSWSETKILLKRAAATHVPSECVYRPKEGFSIPIKNWLGTEFRPLLEELLKPKRLSAEGLFVPEQVERLKQEHLAGHRNHSHILWALMVFHAWRDRVLEA